MQIQSNQVVNLSSSIFCGCFQKLPQNSKLRLNAYLYGAHAINENGRGASYSRQESEYQLCIEERHPFRSRTATGRKRTLDHMVWQSRRIPSYQYNVAKHGLTQHGLLLRINCISTHVIQSVLTSSRRYLPAVVRITISLSIASSLISCQMQSHKADCIEFQSKIQ